MKKDRNTGKTKRKSLFLLINVSIIVLNILSICVISIIIYATWQKSIREAITKLEDNIYGAIYSEIDHMISNSLSVNEASQYLIKNDIIDIYNITDRKRFLSGLLNSLPDDIKSVCYVTESGDYYSAQRNNTNNKIEFKAIMAPNPYSSNSDTNDINIYGYKDMRKSDWYLLAKEKGRQIISEPVKSDFNDTLLVTAAYPIYTNDEILRGVLASHIRLKTINNTLYNMLNDKLGEGYIIDKHTGAILANSKGSANYRFIYDGSYIGIPYSNISNQAITDAYKKYISTGHNKYFLSYHRTKYHVNVNEYENHDIDWVIITGFPESILSSAFQNNLISAVMLCILTVLISIFFTFIGSRIILKPIKHLVITAQQLSNGELSVRANVFRNDDIGVLAYAFNHMADEINNQINTLEERIKERTAELAAANKALLEAKEQSEAANKLKNRFIANVSHEVRTPLNGISGFLQLLENTSLTEEQADYVKTIAVSTEALLSIVNDLLDLSKIEAGRMLLEQIPFELKSNIETAIHLFDVKAALKGLTFNICYDNELPAYVIGDPIKLRQIISNLVSNAVKFTNEGYITILVNLEALTDNRVYLSFSIEDTGIGLSMEEIDRLFIPFSQADSSSTRKYGGTGLGLVICKNLIEMMHGEIIVQSKAGEGSDFQFYVVLTKASDKDLEAIDSQTIPIGQVLPGEASIVSTLSDLNTVSKSVKQHRDIILLVEDNEINSKFFMKLLKIKGYSCDLAKNGEEALRAYEQKHYDIIFMDCQLPVMDGYETTRQIRAMEEAGQHTAIIALTAFAMEEDKQKCFEAGMDDFINKPIPIDLLIKILEKHQNSRKNTTDIFSDIIQIFMAETDFDYETCLEFIQDFNSQSALQISNIKTAICQHNPANACYLLHKLKGSSGIIRAKQLSELAAKAEEAMKNDDLSTVTVLLEKIERLALELKKTTNSGLHA